MSVARDKVARVWLSLLLVGPCVVAFAPKFSAAQDVSSDSTKNIVSGTVINAVTRAPIPRALVTSADNRYAKLTDSSGQFEFDMPNDANEPSRRFSNATATVEYEGVWLTARKPGFLTEGENGTNASPGQDVTIPLTPEALIVGRVTFSIPETTTSVTVQLFFRQVQDGLPRWTQQSSANTNSAGEFRFANLRPGSYKLSTTESLDNDPGAIIARTQAYGFPPVYYPNASDFATAGTIEVSAGQTIEADLSLVRQAYYQVRIPVNGDISGGVNIVVSPQGHHGPGYSLGINALEHRIEGLLPNGNYVVDAISYGENAASGTANLRVAGGPADGAMLTMVPNSGIVLNVKEEFTEQPGVWGRSSVAEGGAPPRNSTVYGKRAYLQPNLEPADDFGNGMSGSLRPPLGPNDDTLVLTNVPPGRYWLRLNSGRGYVASATMGTIDVLHQPITISAGSGGQIDITMRDEYAFVEGSVAPPNSSSPKIPNNFSTIDFVPLSDGAGQFQEIGAGPDGNIGRISLVPGGYRVLAFSGARRDLPYRDPQAMKAYETKGQVIHVEPGQQVNLQLQPISEEQ